MGKKYLHIPALDGLRGLACLFVLFCHAGYLHFMPLVVGMGSFGVMLFFTLSGFLMAYKYLPDSFSKCYWLGFLAHRFIRVYPAFFLATFGYLIVWHMIHYLPQGVPLAHNWHGLIPSWLLREQHDGVLWTIPVELKFYVLYPFLAFVISLLSFPVFFMMVIVFWIVLIYMCNLQEPLWGFLYLSFFIFGVFSGVFFKKYDSVRIKTFCWDLVVFICLITFYFWITGFGNLNPSRVLFWSYTWFLAPLLALSIFSIGQCKGIIGWLFTNPLSSFVGHMSYSLFLVHWFIINILAVILSRSFIDFIFLFAVIFLVSYLFYLFIEKPCIHLSRNISKKVTNYGIHNLIKAI